MCFDILLQMNALKKLDLNKGTEVRQCPLKDAITSY